MPDKFKILLYDLISGKGKALSTLRKNVEIVLSQHFSKKYIEISWIAKNNEIYSSKAFLDDIFNEFLKLIEGNIELINSFSEYKEFIISKANNRNLKLFRKFFDLLLKNNEKVWSVFDNLLKKRINSWLIKKASINNKLYEQLYQEAQIVFLKNLKKKELSFENSRFLKSYIFKIINLKLLEYNRTNKDRYFINIIEIENTYSGNCNENISDIDKEDFLKNLFKKLSALEKNILFEVYFREEKLKDTAKKFDITEANCRVIKHRALAKLEEPASRLGYR